MTMRSRVIAAAAILVVLAIAATAAYVVLFPKPANAVASATATIFIGNAQVERNGSTTFATLHSGDQLAGGDTVRTGAASKAAINGLTRASAGASTSAPSRRWRRG